MQGGLLHSPDYSWSLKYMALWGTQLDHAECFDRGFQNPRISLFIYLLIISQVQTPKSLLFFFIWQFFKGPVCFISAFPLVLLPFLERQNLGFLLNSSLSEFGPVSICRTSQTTAECGALPSHSPYGRPDRSLMVRTPFQKEGVQEYIAMDY